MEMIAEMTYEEVLKYMEVLNNGYTEDEFDKKLLSSFGIICEDNSLQGYKKRIVTNVLKKDCNVDGNPFLPLKVSPSDYEKVCNIVQNNPHNNVTLTASDGKSIRTNSNLMIFRSKYMRNRLANQHYKKSTKKQFYF